MKRICTVLICLLAAMSAASLAAQNPSSQQGHQGQADPDALKKYPDGEKIWTTVPIHTTVLPKGDSVQQLADIMMEWKAAIGGHCVTCHTITSDSTYKNAMGHAEIMPYDDAISYFNASQRMYLMTEEINKKYMPGKKDPVTCSTCHRGKLVPPAYGYSGHDAPTSMAPFFTISKQLTPAQEKAAQKARHK